MRSVLFTAAAWDDYVWRQVQDRKTLTRINELTRDTQLAPFEGIGKPESLRGNLSGFWSRRIDAANRLVYEASDGGITIISCRYRY